MAPAAGCPSRFHRVRTVLQPLGVLIVVVVFLELWTLLVVRDADSAWALPAIGAAGAAGLGIAGRSTWRQLESERRLSPPITARYRTLASLLDQSETLIIPPGSDAVLLLPMTGREVLRFDRDEFTSALAIGIADTVVYERFLLSPARPVVFHNYSTMTLPPRRDRDTDNPDSLDTSALTGDLDGLVELSRRTGIDEATEADLDGLIAQLRAFAASRVH